MSQFLWLVVMVLLLNNLPGKQVDKIIGVMVSINIRVDVVEMFLESKSNPTF